MRDWTMTRGGRRLRQRVIDPIGHEDWRRIIRETYPPQLPGPEEDSWWRLYGDKVVRGGTSGLVPQQGGITGTHVAEQIHGGRPLIREHVWRPPFNGWRDTGVAVEERPCAYGGCGRPRGDHARAKKLGHRTG